MLSLPEFPVYLFKCFADVKLPGKLEYDKALFTQIYNQLHFNCLMESMDYMGEMMGKYKTSFW